MLSERKTQRMNQKVIKIKKMKGGQDDRGERSCVYLLPWAYKNYSYLKSNCGFPRGSDSKESTCNAGDPASIPGLGRSPREGNGNPL